MNKFIYKIEKNELDEGVELDIYSTNGLLNTKCEKIKTNYQIFTKKREFERLKIKTDKIKLADEYFFNKNGEKVVKIEILSKELYKYILNELREHKIETYETDIAKEHRYLIEKGIKLYVGEKDKIPKLKYVSIDIETIGLEKDIEVIMISAQSPFDEKINKVYVNVEKLSSEKRKEVLKTQYFGFSVVICRDEEEILSKFKEDIVEFEPQAIIGWNVIDFDFKVIKERMKVHKIEFNFGKSERVSKLRIVNDFYKDSTMDVTGVLVFDIIQLLKTNFIFFDDYKLNTVAKAVLKDEKIDIIKIDTETSEGVNTDDKVKMIELQFTSKPSLLIDYNFKDSQLVSKIVEELNLIDLMVSRSIITNTPILRVKSPIATLDVMYLTELRKRGKVAVSNFNYERSGPISGAYVVEPERGFYEDVFVFDFKSLYPSIIMTFNIDPFTYVGNREDETGEERREKREERKSKREKRLNAIYAPNGAKFSRERGILPDLILKLYKERDVAKKEEDSVKSFALKTTMNSFYGAVASPKSRFHNKDVGGAITAFGREIIKRAKTFAEEKGLNVVYGDTDSVFIQIPDLVKKTLSEKKKAGILLEKELNSYFKGWIDSEFGTENFLTIEMEKIFSKFFIASKKRYVGFDDMSKKIKYTGMEAIRGDWTQLAKTFQMRIIEQIFEDASKSKIEKFIKEFVSDLKEGKFDDLLEYHKKITKPLEQYIKTTPPHVRAARELRGFSGRLVRYVMLKRGPTHVSLIREEKREEKDGRWEREEDRGKRRERKEESKPSLLVNYDYEHYIEKQLKGVSDDILECFGIEFDAVSGMRKQKSLDGFF